MGKTYRDLYEKREPRTGDKKRFRYLVRQQQEAEAKKRQQDAEYEEVTILQYNLTVDVKALKNG